MPRRKKRSSEAKWVAAMTVVYVVGTIVGAYVFRNIQPRSVLALTNCHDASCLTSAQALGLAAAVGIELAPQELPLIVEETDKTIAFSHPYPGEAFHYIIVPKKDIENVGELTSDDQAYLIDAYAVMDQIIRSQHLTNYYVTTNGPGYQKVAYLHFHSIGNQN